MKTYTDQELSEAVARKLGYNYDEKWQGWAKDGGRDFVGNCPAFSIDIAATWEIVSYLVAHEKQIVINCDSWGQVAAGVYRRKEYECLALETASTAPRALCEAFLKLPDEK